MLNKAIERNERFLRLCCNIARFFGLLLIAFVVITLISIPLVGGPGDGYIVQLIPRIILGFVFPAFLLLGIEQLIKCLIVPDFKPNWILRFGDKFIYTYTIFLFINFVYSSIYTHKMINSSGYDISFVSQTLIPSGIFTFIKILIWIGIGMLLKRIVPIIQESKTLV